MAQNVNAAVSNAFTIGGISLSFPAAVAVADFNGDSRVDMVAAGPNAITILLGNGDGTFRTSASIPNTSTGPATIAVGDFNLDGKPDIAVSNGGSSITVLLGYGDGTFQSPVQYQADQFSNVVTVGDFNGDGKPDLAIVGYSVDPTYTFDILNVAILLGNGDGTFRAPAVYAIDGFGQSIVTGDFNGDGKTDLAVTDNNGVDILLGNGDGSFQPFINYPAGLNPGSIAVGDFNADGKLDLAVGNINFDSGVSNQNNVSILIANGDGTFQPPVNYAASNYPAAIAVSDFNGDGKLDLAVANDITQTVSILLGKGDGTFGPPLNQNLTFGPMSIAVADFNGDGSVDIAVPSSSGGNAIGILLGSNYPDFAVSFTQSGPVTQGQTGVTYVLSAANIGFSTYTAPVQINYALGAGLTVTGVQSPGWACSTSGSSGTCNRSDSVASGQSYPSITLTVSVSASAPPAVTSNATLSFLNQAAPPFSASVATSILQNQTITFPLIPSHTFGDPSFSDNVSSSSGLPVTVLSSGTCSILGSIVTIDGAGTCTLTASQAGNSYWSPAASVTRTFSIAGAYTSVALAATRTSLQFGQPVTLTASIMPARTLDRVTFFDGTSILGTVPVVAGNATLTTSLLGPGTHSLKAYYGGITSTAVAITVNALGISGFVNPSPALPNVTMQYLAIGDFNGDGRADVVAGNGDSPYLSVLLGNGDGTFLTAASAYTGLSYFQPQAIAVGDFNGDGKADLVVPSFQFGQFAILLGNGDGTFQTGVIFNSYSQIQGSPWTVVIGDFNGDGKADLAFPNSVDNTPNTIDVLLGNGDGTFGTPVDLVVPDAVSDLLVGDFNGDGIADLGLLGTSSIDILLGNGDGTFQAIIRNPANIGFTMSSFVAGDFNNDGKLDLAFVTQNNGVGVLLGNGDGTFRSERDYPASLIGEQIASILTGDFNQDQKLDLLVGTPGNVIVLPGNGDGTFASSISYPGANLAYAPPVAASADFNGDGRPDLALASYSGPVSILLGASTPVLSISLSHNGNFTVGQANATYTIAVQNTGLLATSGTVSVNGFFNAALTVTSIGGSGWTCSITNVQCTRSDILAPGGSYPPISVAVNPTSGPGSFVSQASVSGGGSPSASSSDFTTITAPGTAQLAFIAQPSGGPVVTPIAPVVVEVQDASGNLIASSNASITVASSPAGVTTTVNAVNGVATFSGLVFGSAGTYTLTASSPGFNSATSNSFNIGGGTSVAGLDFYPVTPCRVADTRNGAGFTGAFGPPSIAGGTTRGFNIPSSSCGIPPTAVAYSLNFTVVPPPGGPQANLTTWPTGLSTGMPNVSTLNFSSSIVANAAIVAAGTNGSINVYVTGSTDVLFDINGYFAPPLPSGLEFFTLTPCRIADTREARDLADSSVHPQFPAEPSGRSTSPQVPAGSR